MWDKHQVLLKCSLVSFSYHLSFLSPAPLPVVSEQDFRTHLCPICDESHFYLTKTKGRETAMVWLKQQWFG